MDSQDELPKNHDGSRGIPGTPTYVCRIPGCLCSGGVGPRTDHDAALARSASEDDLRRYAQSIPDIARAASENYDIANAAMLYLAVEVSAMPGSIRYGAGKPPRILSADQRGGVTWEERPAPRQLAFDCRDAVVAYVATISRPTSVAIEVMRIQRVTVKVTGVSQAQYTAVIVAISSPAAKTHWVVFAAEGGRT